MSDHPHKKPGETAFAAALALLSLFLLWQAYGISGFEALSSPGAFPMAAAAIMLVSALAILVRTLRNPHRATVGFFESIAPPQVIVMFVAIGIYGALLVPLGFLPTSFLFLTGGILLLRRGGLVYSVVVATGALALVYLIFRIVFSVLMPEGIVPEGEILSAVGGLFGGAE